MTLVTIMNGSKTAVGAISEFPPPKNPKPLFLMIFLNLRMGIGDS